MRALLKGLGELQQLRKLALKTTLDDDAAQEVAGGLPQLSALMHLELLAHPFSHSGSRCGHLQPHGAALCFDCTLLVHPLTSCKFLS